MSIHSALCSVRVGRDREVESLRTLSVTRRMTLITGPAGIGKSQISLEALRIAREAGFATLVGNCTPDLTLPFAPFVSALRRRTRTLEAETLAELFGGSAALSATLLPEVARSLNLDVEPQSQDDLFASIWQLLHRLANDGGCILLLEDLHWADSDTLSLMSYLSGELEGLDTWIVGTLRADEIQRRHPHVEVVAELSRERRFEEIVLLPLTKAEIAEMVRTIFGSTDVDDEFIDALFERTLGNPFFIEEILRVLIDKGDVYQESGGWARRDLADIALPMTVRETLLTRVRSLPPHEVEFIRVAAIAGQRLDLDVLAAATGQPMDVVEGIIGNAQALQLLAEHHEMRGNSYGFRQPSLVKPSSRRWWDLIVVRRTSEWQRQLSGCMVPTCSPTSLNSPTITTRRVATRRPSSSVDGQQQRPRRASRLMKPAGCTSGRSRYCPIRRPSVLDCCSTLHPSPFRRPTDDRPCRSRTRPGAWHTRAAIVSAR
jgi:predicted ATPase